MSEIRLDKYSKSKFKVFVSFTVEEKVIVNNEIAKLRLEKVIYKTNIKDKNTFVSGVFTS